MTQLTYNVGKNGSFVPQIQNTSLWYVANRYVQMSQFVSNYPYEAFLNPDWLFEYRFILDNRRALSTTYMPGMHL